MKITIYSTTTCPYCVMLKRWLDDKKVAYTDYLVDQNPIAAQNMVRLSGQMGVPFRRYPKLTTPTEPTPCGLYTECAHSDRQKRTLVVR
jgi:hypothetical protein